MDGLVIAWAKAFFLTVLVEIPIASFVLRDLDRSWARRAVLALFASLATHPAVWFIFPRLDLTYPQMIAAAETWAVVIEAVFYGFTFRGLEPWRAVGVSLLANGASFGTGLLVRAYTGWV